MKIQCNGFALTIYAGDDEVDHFNGNNAEPLIDANVDVRVDREDGRAYHLTFFTLKNLQSLMKKFREATDSDHANYVWASNMVVVENLSAAVIREAVTQMIVSDDLRNIALDISDNEPAEIRPRA
jgi:hypothetical protein